MITFSTGSLQTFAKEEREVLWPVVYFWWTHHEWVYVRQLIDLDVWSIDFEMTAIFDFRLLHKQGAMVIWPSKMPRGLDCTYVSLAWHWALKPKAFREVLLIDWWHIYPPKEDEHWDLLSKAKNFKEKHLKKQLHDFLGRKTWSAHNEEPRSPRGFPWVSFAYACHGAELPASGKDSCQVLGDFEGPKKRGKVDLVTKNLVCLRLF